jgi:hypothetical protein
LSRSREVLSAGCGSHRCRSDRPTTWRLRSLAISSLKAMRLKSAAGASDESLRGLVGLAGDATTIHKLPCGIVGTALASSTPDWTMATRTAQPSRQQERQLLTEVELLKLASGNFIYCRCRICEWEGQLAQSQGRDPDCPVCHAPTDLVAFLQPISQIDASRKNPHAAALGRLGGQRGGPARAALLSPKRRREIARKAALARWKNR